MARGDILLYHETDLVSRIIQWRTHGPYNHVAVDIGGGKCVGAYTSGVTATDIGIDVVFVPLPPSPHLEDALQWLLAQLKSGYSWTDIVDDIFPSWLPIRPIFSQAHAYDCSDLVAQYLDRAGLLSLSELGGDAQTVTPNDLWRAFKKQGWMR